MAKEVNKLKKMPARSADQAKAQNAAKLKKTVVESGNKSGKLATTAVKKALDKPNKVEKLIQDVTNRYRVTAREARDIVTAVGTVGTIATGKYMTDKPAELKKSAKNLVKQVKETASAATTGSSGTRSGTAYPGTPTGYYEPKKKNK